MIKPLTPEKLRRKCDPSGFDFESTAELTPAPKIIGQPRGTQAIEFGLQIDSPGYNIFVLGESGTGRATAIQRFIEHKAAKDPVPDDWAYAYNFQEPHKPVALRLPPGVASEFRDRMDVLVKRLTTEVTRAFDNETFRDAALEIQHTKSEQQDTLFEAFQAQAGEVGAVVLNTPDGFRIVPGQNGQPLPPQALAGMPPEQETTWKKTAHNLEHDLNEVLYQLRLLDRKAEEQVKDLVRRVASSVVDVALEEIKAAYSQYDNLQRYLTAAHEDILQKIQLFRLETDEEEENHNIPRELLLRRYKINLLVDHQRDRAGAPVLTEYNPTLPRLLGRVEHEPRAGGIVMTDFMQIRGGALHEANGGYLVLRARDLFNDPNTWEALKRALIGGSIVPDDPAARVGAATKSLDPEPIPLHIKLVLIGPPQVYYALYQSDEDFQKIFKVMADFDLDMDRTPENEREYAAFIAALCRDENLMHFSRDAVGRVVEHGSRLAGSQNKLSTRFGDLADFIREAHYWASQNNHTLVMPDDVLKGIAERLFRGNRIENRVRETILTGKQLITAEGTVVGQVNGLYVSPIGAHSFGQPSRVTARTFIGQAGVVQIDREAEMAGPIHNKGVLTLTGYLGGQYAVEVPLSFSAQITFEQTYSGIEGDSAASTELFALISSLAEVPVSQAIAVTGSVSQNGEIQAIGGVNQKIEGWFELCQARGLTGQQGVIIPAANVDDLMLRVYLLEAVSAGQFHIWAVQTVDEGLEVLTGLPAAQVHQKAATRLAQLAKTSLQYKLV